MFPEDHVHPLAVPTHKKCPLRLPRVTAADPQDLLEDKSSSELQENDDNCAGVVIRTEHWITDYSQVLCMCLHILCEVA